MHESINWVRFQAIEPLRSARQNINSVVIYTLGFVH